MSSPTFSFRRNPSNNLEEILYGDQHVAWINAGDGRIGPGHGKLSPGNVMLQDVTLTPGTGVSQYTFFYAVPAMIPGGKNPIPLNVRAEKDRLEITSAGEDDLGYFRYAAHSIFEADPQRAGQLRVRQSFEVTLIKDIDAAEIREGKLAEPPRGCHFHQVPGLGPCWLIELIDPFLHDLRGPSTRISADHPYRVPYAGNDCFTTKWKKQFQHYVFETSDGKIKSLPLAHERANLTSGRYAQLLKNPSRAGYGLSEQGNPFLTVECNEQLATGMCNWIYDQHFFAVIPFNAPREVCDVAHRVNHFIALPEQFKGDGVRLRAGRKFDLKVKVEVFSPSETRAMLQKAEPVDVDEPDLHSLAAMPALELGRNKFQTPVTDLPDAQAWKPASTAVWDRTMGFREPGSLRIQNSGHVSEGAWQAIGGRSSFGEPIIPGRKYRISARIKTINAHGAAEDAGACIEAYVTEYKNLGDIGESRGEIFHYKTPLVKKHTHWAYVETEAGPFPENCSYVELIAKLRGPGVAWFDEITFEPME